MSEIIETKDNVALYSFSLKYGEDKYGGQIPAYSWEEAQEMVERFGGQVEGLLIEEQEIAPCAICGVVKSKDLTNPEPLTEDFPEESPVFDL